MAPEQKKRLMKLCIKGGILLLLGIAYYLFIRITGWGIPCMVYSLTGTYCSGCGITRMCMALVKLDFAAAVHYNALVTLFLPFLGVFGLRRMAIYVRTGNSGPDRLESVLLTIAAILVVAFWILRNLPAFSWLAPI